MGMAELEQHEISDIIQMALSDRVSFADIEGHYGLKESQVKTLMRQNLKRGRYQAWRKRVARFASRRARSATIPCHVLCTLRWLRRWSITPCRLRL